MGRLYARVRVFLGLLVGFLAATGFLGAQQVHRNGFEALTPAWVKSGADVPYEEITHTMSEQGAHDGQRSEYIQINARAGNFIHYQYSIGKGPISDEFTAALWVKSNRAGAQLVGRLILPNERNPQNLQERLTTMLRGDVYRNVGRWQRLEIGRPVQLTKQQQQLMQAELKRPLNFADAYLDAMLLNVYAGPGPTEIWIDDLEVGPVTADSVFQPNLRPHAGREPATSPLRGRVRGQIVEFNGSRLLVGGRPFFIRGIKHSDTPLATLRAAGFNAVWVDPSTSPALLREAVDLGLWLVPQLQAQADEKGPGSQAVASELARYTESDAVLLWHLGTTLAYEQAAAVGRTAQLVRGADPGRPVGADVWDGLMPYSRSLNLVGIHRWPRMTTLELAKYREWLELRRRLAHPGTFLWTWIQTHLPDWYTYLLYDRSGADDFKEPIGPQAEQIRLLTYTALAAGCRGLGFWSDRFLADGHQGRDRLLCCGLLNQELEMLEPLLVMVDDPPQWINTSSDDVKAAVLRTPRGTLVIPIWIGKGAQFVPGQAAVSKLSLVVPQVPQSNQAWEVLPGDVRGLRPERVVGGLRVTLPEFGLTSAIVFTSDTNLVIRFQEQARSRRQLAAQWTYDMAVYELEKVAKIEEQLQKLGHTEPDARNLIQDAESRLRTARQMWESRLFAEAYRESQRALRPLRILMRAQWEKAVKDLDAAVASPYTVSYFTLPRHWELMEEMKKRIPTASVLSGGDFEIVPERTQDSWRVEELTLDEVELVALRVGAVTKSLTGNEGGGVPAKVELPHEGKQCAMLQIKAKNPKLPPQALERTLLALTSPSIKLPPGSWVQVSGWVQIPEPITASPDGALFYDSAGGEPLAIRLTETKGWKKFTLFRKVPSTGTINVTVALTGLGTAYFDDLRIEPLVPAADTASAGVAATGPR